MKTELYISSKSILINCIIFFLQDFPPRQRMPQHTLEGATLRTRACSLATPQVGALCPPLLHAPVGHDDDRHVDDEYGHVDDRLLLLHVLYITNNNDWPVPNIKQQCQLLKIQILHVVIYYQQHWLDSTSTMGSSPTFSTMPSEISAIWNIRHLRNLPAQISAIWDISHLAYLLP